MKNRLRDERIDRGLSQGQLAQLMDVSRQTINAVEADKYDPSLPLVYKLAAFFDIQAEELFLNPYRHGPDQASIGERAS